jgi:thioredoxin reductase (NADPH)
LDIANDKDLCITSDDLFSLSEAPGKTLVVGASYVALECAGFLAGLKYDTTVMMRSIPLRGFDQQCAEMICSYMEETGTKFIRGAIPASVEKTASGKIKVSWKPTTGEGEMVSDEFDTVLLAIGRYALTDACNVAAAGVQVTKNKKIEGTGESPGVSEQTNVKHIFAIGDVLEGRPELTPVAIQAGIMLARRLFGGSTAAMDYDLVPTAVFSPLEYGCVGMSEEDAIAKFGDDAIDVYHQQFKPLELTLPGRGDNASYVKVLVNKKDSDRIVGMHYLGWNAGEVIQGFGIALKLRATKSDLDGLVGIHPTSAEIFTTLSITKRSGADFKAAGC